MYRVWWFPEYSPSEQKVFDKVMKIVQDSYKQLGYTHIETPAVERTDVLTAKSWQETWKQIFWLYWLAQWDKKEYSLHFDLTVPFARYVLDWENELAFPFKRSQIQKVWRWERTQKWRFKELYQADIDVIWPAFSPEKINIDNIMRLLNDDNIYYDAEVIFVLYTTIWRIIKYMCIDDIPQVHINNKKIITWFISYILDWISPEELYQEIQYKIFWLVDRFHKVSTQDFADSMKNIFNEYWLDFENKWKVFLNFINSGVKDVDALSWMKELIDNKLFYEWMSELCDVIKTINTLWNNFGAKVNYIIDFAIVRGLDYYTWTVFETFLPKEKSFWSVCSGWRYDNLTMTIDPKRNYSWVWGSIWISRFMSYVFDNKLVNLEQKTITDYLFLNFFETFDSIVKVAGSFFAQGNSIEIYPSSDKLKKQFQYADKKWIPYVVILWEWELQNWVFKIKNMKTWEELIYKL